jgi:hypothetical protein
LLVAHKEEIVRFMTWFQLEHGQSPQRAAVTEAMNAKITAITDAQRRGTVTPALPAGLILALVLGLASMWNRPSEDIRSMVPEQDRRQAVVDAVARLVQP